MGKRVVRVRVELHGLLNLHKQESIYSYKPGNIRINQVNRGTRGFMIFSEYKDIKTQ